MYPKKEEMITNLKRLDEEIEVQERRLSNTILSPFLRPLYHNVAAMLREQKVVTIKCAMHMITAYNNNRQLSPMIPSQNVIELITSLRSILPLENDFKYILMSWISEKGSLQAVKSEWGNLSSSLQFYANEMILEAAGVVKKNPSLPQTESAVFEQVRKAKEYWIEFVRDRPIKEYPTISKKEISIETDLKTIITTLSSKDPVSFWNYGGDSYRATIASTVQGNSVIDVGSGIGYMLPYLSKNFETVTALDCKIVPSLEKIATEVKATVANSALESYQGEGDVAIVSAGEFFSPEQAVPHLARIATRYIIVGVQSNESPIVQYAYRESNLPIPTSYETKVKNFEPKRWENELAKYCKTTMYSYDGGRVMIIIAEKK